jgi:hypothetical protein
MDIAREKQAFFQKHYVEDAKTNEDAQAKFARLTKEWAAIEQSLLAQQQQQQPQSGRVGLDAPAVAESKQISPGPTSPPSSSGAAVLATPARTNGSGGSAVLVDDVFVISPNSEFEYQPGTDGARTRGSFHFLDQLHVFSVFTRPSTASTYLSVYGITSERTVRLRIRRDRFDPVGDLEIATLFFEPPLEELKESFNASRSTVLPTPEGGHRVHEAPVMTGISELDSDEPITVYEEPHGYHQNPRVIDGPRTVTGAVTVGGGELQYRAHSTADGHTKVVVLEHTTGRKLFFTVIQPVFDRDAHMDIAATILGNVRARTPTFRPAVRAEDMERVLIAFSSPERLASPSTMTYNRPMLPEDMEPPVDDDNDRFSAPLLDVGGHAADSKGDGAAPPMAPAKGEDKEVKWTHTGSIRRSSRPQGRRVPPGKLDKGTHMSMKYAPLLNMMRGYY